MHITSINNNEPKFYGVERYKHISRLPNLTCACCGKKVINGDVMQRAFASVARTMPTKFIGNLVS